MIKRLEHEDALYLQGLETTERPVKIKVFHRETCRLCDGKNVELVVKLEPIPLAEKYAATSQLAREADVYPVDLYMCVDCGHVQQLDVIDSQNLWEGYTYYSGQAKGMVEHFEQVSAQIIKYYQPPVGALVVDVGSNDGSLLRPFKRAGYRVLGVDPAREIARRATDSGIKTIPELQSLRLAREIRQEHGPAYVVSAFNAFAHADNMGEMAESIRYMLESDGLFFFEVHYLLDIIDKVLIGTIFHEHMSHHSVKPMRRFLSRHGMELIDVERVSIQHGSLIGTAQLAGGKRRIKSSVDKLLQLESERGLDRPATLKGFATQLERLRDNVSKLIDKWEQAKVSVAGYGAARSGPTLISQLKLSGVIDYIVDDHPQKVHKYSPGDGIPILPTEELCKRMPAYTIILAWVHAEKIVAANKEYLDNGGHFVVLCPEIRIIGSRGDVGL